MFKNIQQQLHAYPSAQLVCVAKNQSCPDTQSLIDSGANILAFSQVQEAEQKLSLLRFDGEVHCIGHLQKNKVKKAIQIFHLIHSVDSLALTQKISQESRKQNKTTNILLQVNSDADEKKHGFPINILNDILPDIACLPHISVCGLMMIGEKNITDDNLHLSFQRLREIFDQIQKKNIFEDSFQHLSMGMSRDYLIALEEGATLIRVGRVLFE